MQKLILFLILAVLVIGCADEKSPSVVFATSDSAIGGGEYLIQNTMGRVSSRPSSRQTGNEGEIKSLIGNDKQSPAIVRKIIYNADVHLVVDNFETGESQLKRLITQYNGQIASSDQRGQSGSQRTGHWKVRIPVENFDAFKAAVEKVGNLERSTINSSDVTEEFYDIEARLKNKKVEETRLLAHLEKSTAKLSDILDVEKELSRVRSEIEQMQGRLNLLSNFTNLTTVDINIREVKNYVPPTAPTFGDEVSRTLSHSWSMLVRTGRNISLNLISVLPWLPLWIVLALVCYRPIRWLLGKMRSAPNQPSVQSVSTPA